VVLDVETEPFSGTFRITMDEATRQRLAPTMRLACAFDGRDYRNFRPAETEALLAVLLEADEVISSMANPDELILRKHHGLKGKFPSGARIPICARSSIGVRAGESVSMR
jgi:hypothetical protein